ncbi:MAG: hypothetical protein JSS74_15390 [Actinobacteria bacterium]|nr:hypothetical protein [Actinomycetota bacterium]
MINKAGRVLDFHEWAMGLMVGSAIAATLCCLLVGRPAPAGSRAARLLGGPSVPWQGRQSAVVMGAGMVALCVAHDDPRIALLVAAAGLGSALLGVAGLRGRAQVGDCVHRALGCLAMAMCAVASAGAVRGAPAPAAGIGGHHGSGMSVPIAVLAAGAVGALLVLMAVPRLRALAVVARGALVAPRAPAVLRAPRAPRADGRLLRDVESIAMAASLALMGALALVA